ncbi:MAG: SDR family NAD(P)-dependent oxidoreductase [Chloroflexi bacterium]|nr:SDR family NAD(P)-dependent oxidoreductase [Chloroflexota bacterium]
MTNLQNKTILVVGGAVGIGQATAKLCAERGASVIVADFNETDGKATAQAINGAFIQVYVTKEESVKALFAQIENSRGKLDGLIQTAGILKGAYVAIEELDLATFRQVLDVNTVGSFLCAKYANPLLKRGQLPVIILISSPAAYGVSSSYAYAVSKGGVSALGTTMAGKLAPEGIRVNVVFPGGINTAMKLSVIEADAVRKGQDPQAAVSEAQASGLGEPAGVAKLLAFLVSDDADYVRGSIHTR